MNLEELLPTLDNMMGTLSGQLFGKDILTVNVRKGLLRLWLAVCIPWVLYWGYICVNANLMMNNAEAFHQEMSQEIDKEYHTDPKLIGAPIGTTSAAVEYFKQAIDLSGQKWSHAYDRYERSKTLVLLLPVGSLAGYLLIIWIWRGFNSDSASNTNVEKITKIIEPQITSKIIGIFSSTVEALKFFLSPKGRLSRKNFIIVFFLFYIVRGAASAIAANPDDPLPFIIVWFVLSYSYVVMCIRRLHDLSKPWFYAAPIVPVMIFALFFSPKSFASIFAAYYSTQPLLLYGVLGVIGAIVLTAAVVVFKCLTLIGAHGDNK